LLIRELIQNGVQGAMPSFNPPFTPPPIDVLFTNENLAFTPQHQELVFADPNDGGIQQIFTIYTGELLVNLHADGSAKDQTFQYPILGTFGTPGGNQIGIKQIIFVEGDPNPQFRSAIAYASVTRSELGSNPVWANVGSVSADLMEVELNSPSRQRVNAVVLSGMLTSRNSRLTSISYRVTVLERTNRNPQFPVPVLPVILINDPDPKKAGAGWTGGYNPLPGSAGVGAVLKPGIPQDKIEETS
jgi:hypothetical protein